MDEAVALGALAYTGGCRVDDDDGRRGRRLPRVLALAGTAASHPWPPLQPVPGVAMTRALVASLVPSKRRSAANLLYGWARLPTGPTLGVCDHPLAPPYLGAEDDMLAGCVAEEEEAISAAGEAQGVVGA